MGDQKGYIMQLKQAKIWYEDESFWQTFAPTMFNQDRLDGACKEIDQIIELADIAEDAKILDLCCGQGIQIRR